MEEKIWNILFPNEFVKLIGLVEDLNEHKEIRAISYIAHTGIRYRNLK